MKIKTLLQLFLILLHPGALNAKSLGNELQIFTKKLTTLANLLGNKEIKPIAPLAEGPDFATWKSNCDKLPKYDETNRNPGNETALTFELFAKTLEKYFATMKEQLENTENWLDAKTPDTNLWNKDHYYYFSNSPFVSFVEKTSFDTTDKIAFHGDFHGDIHACNNFVQTWINTGYMNSNFKIIKDDFYIIFLGDYTDRGWYGAEVIYTLLRLKIANPTKVFMARGNHEDLKMNTHPRYGFHKELVRKFADQGNILFNKVVRFYNFLPMAVYIICPSTHGIDIVQCCHGGIEIGYNPKAFLQSNKRFAHIPHFMQIDGYNQIASLVEGGNTIRSEMKNNKSADTYNGFMWSDFITDTSGTILPSGRGEDLFEYGKSVTKKLLHTTWSSDTHSLRAVFRAHQHVASDYDPMKQIILNFNKTRPKFSPLAASWYNAPAKDAGIAFLWSEDPGKKAGSLKDILALTFSVAPGTPYNWPYDAFGLLKLAKGYDNWHMQVYRVKKSEYEKE